MNHSKNTPHRTSKNELAPAVSNNSIPQVSKNDNKKNVETDVTKGNEHVRKMIRYDENNTPFVEIEKDILDGVPENRWNKKVKEVLKSKFKNGEEVGNNTIWQNASGRREFLFSKYAQKIFATDKNLYMDKLKIANDIDEIVTASRDYVNQKLKHTRKDGLKDFAWGL